MLNICVAVDKTTDCKIFSFSVQCFVYVCNVEKKGFKIAIRNTLSQALDDDDEDVHKVILPYKPIQRF